MWLKTDIIPIMKPKPIFYLILLLSLLLSAPSAAAQDDAPLVILLTADGPITPAMREYLARGITLAEGQGAEALILQLNTPGGSVTTMNQMVQDIRNSSVPVIVYVTPRGGWAASAGAVITVAAHASAMAPETTIGAASPVGGQGEDLETTMESKEKNALRATMRSFTERRGPDAMALAEDMIENAMAVYADEALEVGLIDFIAKDLDDLLAQLDGFTVTTDAGEITLQTAGARVESTNIAFIEQLLLILTDPNIVFLLITIGVQAVLIEISSPGGWVAGFIGVCCLGLASYGLGVLPVNWFGILFLGIAFVLFILDIKAPTHGALTAAGVGSLIIGALVLFNSPSVPSFQRVSVPLVIGASIGSGLVFFTILMIALRAQRAPVRMGQESLPGKTGVARSEIAPHGSVQLGGELWSADLAEGEAPIPQGARVEVVRAEGVRLVVRRKQ
ncbi:MAG: nodulation protein NfeD [Anaerolineales bacterium]|nr:nodulation protein NfeD [Anaerolineales bacterium]